MQLAFMEMSSPVGILKLVAHDHALVAVLWENENPKRVRLAELIKNNTHPVLLETAKQLNEYFQGKRTQFDLPNSLIFASISGSLRYFSRNTFCCSLAGGQVSSSAFLISFF